MSILTEANEFYIAYANRDPWEDAAFGTVKRMENDVRGRFGEKIISDALHCSQAMTFDMDFTNANNHDDGHYDLKVNGVRIEIKTSCRTEKCVWQHEPLYRANVCDLVVFLDFDYDLLHLSVIPSTDLPLDRPSPYFIGKKGTLRNGKTDGYKLDFSNKTIKDLAKFGLIKTYDASVQSTDLTCFLEEKINEFIQSISTSN